MPDSLKALTGFTCSRCGKELIGWLPAKNGDGSIIKLCNQCSMLLDWIEAYNNQQKNDPPTKESA